MSFSDGYIFPYLAAAPQTYPAFTGGPRKICLHTTNIGPAPTNLAPAPDYLNWVPRHTSSPQVWADPWRQVVYQSTSLRNGGRAAYSGGTNVNTDGLCHIEINGWAEHTSMWPVEWLEWLGQEVIKPIIEFYTADGWPVNPTQFLGVGDARLTLAQFDVFNGVLQHLHLPMNEGRWDANLSRSQMAIICAAAQAAVEEDDMFTDEDRAMLRNLNNAVNDRHLAAQVVTALDSRFNALRVSIESIATTVKDIQNRVVALPGILDPTVVAQKVWDWLRVQLNK